MKRHQEITFLVRWIMFTFCISILSIHLSFLNPGFCIMVMEWHMEIMHIKCECHKVWFQNRTDRYRQTTQSHLCNYYNGLHVRL